MKTISILSGGGPAPRTPLPRPDLVIAADSGLALATDLGLAVDLVVGDLDSADPTELERAVAAGAVVERHPTDKDATDLELALLAATLRAADRIVVAGGGGGRLDHLLGIAQLLTDERWSAVDLEWHAGSSVAHVVRGVRILPTDPGTVVSLIPISDATVASITGTRWVLERAHLTRGTTRGISNLSTSDQVSVDIHEGVALVVLTGGAE